MLSSWFAGSVASAFPTDNPIALCAFFGRRFFILLRIAVALLRREVLEGTAEPGIFRFCDSECHKLAFVFFNHYGVVLLVEGQVIDFFSALTIDIALDPRKIA